MNQTIRYFGLGLTSMLLISCASSYKVRQEQRDKLATTTGMFCEFVSGDEFTDVDVEVSMRMGKRCEANRPFSLTNYKNASDNSGLVYCCTSKGFVGIAPVSTSPTTPAPKAEAKAEVKSEGKSVPLPTAPTPTTKTPAPAHPAAPADEITE